MPAATRRGASAASPSKSAAKGGRKATESAAAPEKTTAVAASTPPSSPLAQAFYQYGGLLCCVTGVALLWLGYGAGWMHDTKLTLLCVALNVVGLFLHETRPFSLERELKAQQAAKAGAAKAR